MADEEPIMFIACRRGSGTRRVDCDEPGCTREHTHLCDFPLKGRKAGQTCDRKLCDEHATRVQKGWDHIRRRSEG